MAQMLLQESTIFRKTHWNLVKYLTRNNSKFLTKNVKQELLNALNTSEPEILSSFCLSPCNVQKLINEREISKKFNSLSDLIFSGIINEKILVLSKVILKEEQSLEELQSIIASYSNSEENLESKTYFEDAVIRDFTSNRNKSSLSKKKNYEDKIPLLTTPSFAKFENQKFDSVTAISLSVSHIGFTNMDMDGKVENISSIPLFTDLNLKGFRNLELNEIYEKVLTAVKHFPRSDLLICEKGMSNNISPEAYLFSMVKGMLFPLLDKRENLSSLPPPMVFVKNSVVTNLYSLKVGYERKSSVKVGESLLAGKLKLPWKPSVTFNPIGLQKYILATHAERIQMIESLLLAAAFNSVFIKNDLNSHLFL